MKERYGKTTCRQGCFNNSHNYLFVPSLGKNAKRKKARKVCVFVHVGMKEISNKLMYLGRKWRYHDNENVDHIANFWTCLLGKI